MSGPNQTPTLCQRLQESVDDHGTRTAQRWVQTDDPSEEALLSGEAWGERTYEQLGRAVQEVSLGLQSLNVEKGDRVGIVGHNSPEWAIADYAILHAGGTSVTVYPQLPPDQIAYILDDAGAQVCFVGDDELYEKLQIAAKDVPTLETIVRMDNGQNSAHGAAAGNVDAVFPMRNLYEEGQSLVGEGTGEDAFEDRWTSIEPDDLATLIYTSGTTGRPKGVQLTHGNISSNLGAIDDAVEFFAGERFLSFLPLAHSYERTVGHFGTYSKGIEVWYARSIDTVGDDLNACHPNIMIAVPRLWEKMGQKFRTALDEATGLKASLVKWAIGVGEEALDHRLEHQDEPSGWLGVKYGIAEGLLKKIRGRAGLDELRLANSGAAALDPEVARFFWSLGVRIYEGYGLTETAPVLTANRPGHLRLGTVGKTVPGVELKIAEDEWDGEEGEGEIMARGPNVMKGYWKLPEKTDAVLEGEWFRTGDVGQVDEDGYLTITDRRKEIFKTAYGKYVAPENVSRQLKRSDVVGQVLVLGEKRKYVAVLITPDPEGLSALLDEELPEKPARSTLQDLINKKQVQAAFADAVERANSHLPRHEQVKTYRVVPDVWDVGVELTPTLKLKRRVVEDKYADEIEDLFPDE